jgi:hypothetical protein
LGIRAIVFWMKKASLRSPALPSTWLRWQALQRFFISAMRLRLSFTASTPLRFPSLLDSAR